MNERVDRIAGVVADGLRDPTQLRASRGDHREEVPRGGTAHGDLVPTAGPVHLGGPAPVALTEVGQRDAEEPPHPSGVGDDVAARRHDLSVGCGDGETQIHTFVVPAEDDGDRLLSAHTERHGSPGLLVLGQVELRVLEQPGLEDRTERLGEELLEPKRRVRTHIGATVRGRQRGQHHTVKAPGCAVADRLHRDAAETALDIADPRLSVLQPVGE